MARFESIGGGREIFGGEEFEGQGGAYDINVITNHIGYHIPIKKQVKKNVKKQTGGKKQVKKNIKKQVKKQTGPSGAGAMA